jgi:hypothetical protein
MKKKKGKQYRWQRKGIRQYYVFCKELHCGIRDVFMGTPRGMAAESPSFEVRTLIYISLSCFLSSLLLYG